MAIARWSSSLSSRRFRQLAICVVSLLFLASILTRLRRSEVPDFPLHQPRPPLKDYFVSKSNTRPSVPCRGAHGHLIDSPSSKDLPQSQHRVLPGIDYPRPTVGDYDFLGLDKSWMTAEERYGPYGFLEPDLDVLWNRTDWGDLQDQCIHANRHRFRPDDHHGYVVPALATSRFRLRKDHRPRERLPPKTGRQAIVLRTWSTFEYTDEDMWHIRSVITEASLAAGGNYTVILLVDVHHDDGARIHTDPEFYHSMLEKSVPREFRHMAILFHVSLQQDWYSRSLEWRPGYQIMQPLTLFAHFYPEFDHFWQFEMDTRFSGHVGQMLDSFHTFSNNDPIKQARERASWSWIPALHGSWQNFTRSVDLACKGESSVWGPVKIKRLRAIGRLPPVQDPKDDHFEYGVGAEADLVLLNSLNYVNDMKSHYRLRDWYYGFERGIPRFNSAPAMARASWDLLEAVHHAQHTTDMRLESESTLPSFAYWHGLKVSGVPIPKFIDAPYDLDEVNLRLNGRQPWEGPNGTAHGIWIYENVSIDLKEWQSTYRAYGDLVQKAFINWVHPAVKQRFPWFVPGTKSDKGSKVEMPAMPAFMRTYNGKTYMPNLLLHWRKTNGNIINM